MSTKYKFHNQDKLYFVSFAVVNWIDLFIRNEYKNIMLDSWADQTAKRDAIPKLLPPPPPTKNPEKKPGS